MSQAPLILPARARAPREEPFLDRLADCVRRLDPATRALLDLSVRRGVRDELMAPVLKTDPFHLAWRRARALEALATDFGGEAPAPLAEVRAALQGLPEEVWLLGAGPTGLPAPGETSTEQVAPPPEAPPAAREPESGAGTALVPAASLELDEPEPRRRGRVGTAVERLDAFAVASPTLREALAGLARAVGRKAVRGVVWRRRRR